MRRSNRRWSLRGRRKSRRERACERQGKRDRRFPQPSSAHPDSPWTSRSTFTRTLRHFNCGCPGFARARQVPSIQEGIGSESSSGPTRASQGTLFFLALCFRRLMAEDARASPAFANQSPLAARYAQEPSPGRAERAMARATVGERYARRSLCNQPRVSRRCQRKAQSHSKTRSESAQNTPIFACPMLGAFRVARVLVIGGYYPCLRARATLPWPSLAPFLFLSPLLYSNHSVLFSFPTRNL